MREISVRVFDDLDFTRSGERNEAAITVSVGLNGVWRELDLTKVNEEIIRGALDEWMTAGHEPDVEPRPPVKRFGPNPDTVAFNERLRKWVRDNGMRNSSGTGWAYQTNDSLSDYIGKPLVRKYQAYLEAQEAEKEKKNG